MAATSGGLAAAETEEAEAHRRPLRTPAPTASAPCRPQLAPTCAAARSAPVSVARGPVATSSADLIEILKRCEPVTEAVARLATDLL